MKSEKFFNILEGFDFNLLNNSEFKEDSVREEIIVPIIKGLGYSANKPNQIIRSRKLLHPFVSIGSKRKEIFIIPDYLFEVNGKAVLILDAKAPTENITKSVHVEQAYSYAIHSEVRVKYFALCNGREFVLYSIDELKPLLHFPLNAIPTYWPSLCQIIAAENIVSSNPYEMKKDLGLHLKRVGFGEFESLIFPYVPLTMIAQLHPGFYTTTGAVSLEETDYAVSFDFDEKVFNQLKGKIPDEAIKLLQKRLPDSRQAVRFSNEYFYVNIDCKIGDKLEENENEIFLPIWINNILN